MAKAKGEGIRISYKNTHETATCLKGMNCSRAKRFLKNVIKKKEIVPFRRHTGGIGRHSQCRGTGCSQGRWPKKSCYFLLDLVRNAEVNARSKGLKSTVCISRISRSSEHGLERGERIELMVGSTPLTLIRATSRCSLKSELKKYQNPKQRLSLRKTEKYHPDWTRNQEETTGILRKR